MNVPWAQPGDGAAIAWLHVASWKATYRNELPAEFLEGQDLAEREARWEAEITSPSTVLVAEDGQEIAGVQHPTDALIRENLRTRPASP